MRSSDNKIWKDIIVKIEFQKWDHYLHDLTEKEHIKIGWMQNIKYIIKMQHNLNTYDVTSEKSKLKL